MKNNQIGRSMVEMLGVLAIIGVLSVGAIAGYQKAMEKYKINNFINTYSQLIANTLEHYQSLTKEPNNTYLANILEKSGGMPSGMIRDGIYLIDKYFKVKVDPFIRNGLVVLDVYLNIDSENGYFNSEICKILYTYIAIPYHANIDEAWIYRGEENDFGSSWKGDKRCTNKCLKNMTLSDIEATCNECQKNDACMLAIKI